MEHNEINLYDAKVKVALRCDEKAKLLTSYILRVMTAAFLLRNEFSASVGLSGDSSITAL